MAGLLRTEASRFGVDARRCPAALRLRRRPPGDPPGAGLRRLLDTIHPGARDGRHALVRAVIDLAAILDRRVELVEIGLTAGVAGPGRAGRPRGATALVAEAALVPPGEPDDEPRRRRPRLVVDPARSPSDARPAARAPADALGRGAMARARSCRYAAGPGRPRAAGDGTPGDQPLAAPDLIVVAGGAWAVAPGPAIALAVADVVRRPGASQLAWDHARLLGPIGMIGGRGRAPGAAGRAGRGPARAARLGRHARPACGPARPPAG